jgi:hypothetical protein
MIRRTPIQRQFFLRKFPRRLFSSLGRGALLITLTTSGMSCDGSSSTNNPGDMRSHPWHEVKTRHFVLQSNLGHDELVDVAMAYERQQLLVEEMLFGRHLDLPVQTRVFAFRTQEEYEKVTDVKGTQGFFTPTIPHELAPTATMVMAGEFDGRARELFAHEITHRLLYAALDDMPTWLNEGLAQYYAAIREDEEHVVLGENPDRLAFHNGFDIRTENVGTGYRVHVPKSKVKPPSELLKMSAEDFYGHYEGERDRHDVMVARTINYASAWAFVHFCMNGPEDIRNRFASAFAAAAQGSKASATMKKAFEGLSDKTLDTEFLKHLSRRETVVWRTKKPNFEIHKPTMQRDLDSGEVASIALRLGSVSGKETASAIAARQELESMSRSPGAPASALYQVGVMRVLDSQDDAGRELLQKAVDKVPDDPLYVGTYYALRPESELQPDEANRASESLRKIQGKARTAAEHWLIAAAYETYREPGEAVNAAKSAVVADPGCTGCWVMLGRSAMSSGDPNLAVLAQRMAIERLHESASESFRSGLQEQLKVYEAAATEKGGTAK